MVDENHNHHVEEEQFVVEALGQDMGIGKTLLVGQRGGDAFVDVEIVHCGAQEAGHLTSATNLVEEDFSVQT